MTTELLEAPATPQEAVIEKNGHYYEWIDGQWMERRMGAESGWIALRIMTRVGPFVEAGKLGFSFPSEVGYLIFPDNPKRARFGDGSFIRRDRLPEGKPPKGHLQIVPDWMLEVVSPNDLAYEVEDKIANYLQVGIPLVWVVFPNTRCIMIYRQNGTCTRLTNTDELTGEDVLPGFSCRVAELFEEI